MPVSGLFLTPGAGSDSGHSSLVLLEERLAPLPVDRYDFAYRREGRRFPDRAPKLLAALAEDVPAFAEGAGVDPAGLVLWRFPETARVELEDLNPGDTRLD